MKDFIILYLCLVFKGARIGGEPGEFEYEYSIKRDHLQQLERTFSGYQTNYSEDEQIVYSYLEYLKWEEFNRTKNDFPPARPIKLHIDSVKKSPIYQVLRRFPKGGNMHLHHNHVVSKSKILDIIFASPFYENLYIKEHSPGQWRLDFFLNPPNGWTKLKDNRIITKLQVVNQATLLGIISDTALNQPTNSGLRWLEMGPLFSIIGSHIVEMANITKLHMEAMLQSAQDENVQYLETKASSYNKLYVLNSDPAYASKHGKNYIDNDDGELELKMMVDIVDEFKKRNPNFIGYKRIINTSRWRPKKFMDQDLEKALRLYQKYPNLISGFDLVAEEDKGYSLLFFLDDFSKISELNRSLPYFFHTAETNWPDDLLTSLHVDDPVATMENIYDAIVLGAKRVGHGIGFLNHPYLMEILKQRKIAVEANPVSNKMLGYVPDQRHHPAITYLRYGIPVVLGADDPATFGYNEFTLDWYEAFMGWGLNLGDLKQLAMNSLHYSSLSPSEKNVAISKWNKSWTVFINETKFQACASSFANVKPTITKIFPKEGHINGGSKVRVYGRNFQTGICRTIICRFGSVTSVGTFVYNHMLTCPSPHRNVEDKGSLVTPFSISLDSGATFIDTGINYSYLHQNKTFHVTNGEIVG